MTHHPSQSPHYNPNAPPGAQDDDPPIDAALLARYEPVNFAHLDRVVSAELHKVYPNPRSADSGRGHVLGLFISAGLRRRAMSIDDLMRATDLTRAEADALLAGTLSPALLTDALLGRISQALELESSLLRLMLSRKSAASAARSGSRRQARGQRGRHHP